MTQLQMFKILTKMTKDKMLENKGMSTGQAKELVLKELIHQSGNIQVINL